MYRTLVLLLLLLPGMLPAQDREAFRGTIGYHITWTGARYERLKPFLPDSLTLHLSYPSLRLEWSGGLSDTLNMDVYWSAVDGQYRMVQGGVPGLQVMPTDFHPASPKLKWAAAPESLLDHTVWKTGTQTDTWWADTLLVMGRSAIDTLGLLPPLMAAGTDALPLRFQRKLTDGTFTLTAVSLQPAAGVWKPAFPPQGQELFAFDPFRFRHPLSGEAAGTQPR